MKISASGEYGERHKFASACLGEYSAPNKINLNPKTTYNVLDKMGWSKNRLMLYCHFLMVIMILMT
jgi:hypothetical protein